MSEIKSLTSLRGIAAMAVVMQHFSATAQTHAAVTIPSLVPHGYMAVDLFFVLSGFIMTYTYGADFETHGMRAFAGFMGKRVARIVPLNILAVAGAPTIAELERLGVRRVSVGSGPMRAAMALTERIARELLDHGTYASMTDHQIAYADANPLFASK